MNIDYTRYLAAKETVDERSLNPRVWMAFLQGLERRRGVSETLHVVEVGGGVGATLRRLLASMENRTLDYTIVDNEPSHFSYIEARLDGWMTDLGCTPESGVGPGRRYRRGDVPVTIELICADVEEFMQRPSNQGAYDALIAQAFLDMFDVDAFLPRLLSLLAPGGCYYFPITFDGVTSFLPVIDPHLDALVEARYHASMDERAQHTPASPRSQTGRHTIPLLRKLGTNIVSVGASDWIVYAAGDRGYLAEESYFLAHILQCVDNELQRFEGIDRDTARNWMKQRYEQLNKRELIYIAHQLDIAGFV